MTELKKVTKEIFNNFSKKITFEEMIALKEISNEEMKSELLKRGWTKERCFESDHHDVDEDWLHEVFK